MSDSLLSNPKVALGFAGVVVAVALVASVALEEYSPGDQTAQGAEQAQAAPAQPAQSAPAPVAATGWAGGTGVSDDWGAPSTSMQNGGFAGPAPQTNDAPVFDNRQTQSVSRDRIERSSGPQVTTNAAPGAPPVVPPNRGATGQIAVTGG